MPSATFVTNRGSFTVSLMPEHAPKTVENFVGLATGAKGWTDPRDGSPQEGPLYPGTIFHRVIDGFMIQGGDPVGSGRGGPGYEFEDECPPDGPTFNQVGRLAMANAGPGTNGSQFFVTVAETPWLNGKHTIFGQVTDGYDAGGGDQQGADRGCRQAGRRRRDRADRHRRLTQLRGYARAGSASGAIRIDALVDQSQTSTTAITSAFRSMIRAFDIAIRSGL